MPVTRLHCGPIESVHKSALLLWKAGETDNFIAEELGVTRSAVSTWRKRHSLKRNSRKGRTYADWHYRAWSLYNDGMTPKDISELIGKKRRTVQTTLFRMVGHLRGRTK
jgi:DNA-binding transcriptional regulator LsrR (DeoR family)